MVNPLRFALTWGTVVLLASTATCQIDFLAMPTQQFDQFLPGWNKDIQGYLSRDCSDVFAEYKTGRREPGSSWSSLVTPVITCILECFNESRKAELTPSSVLLGLLPTVLQTVGSSPMDIAMIGINRPVLAFLLSVANPAVRGLATNEITHSVEALLIRNKDTTIHTPEPLVPTLKMPTVSRGRGLAIGIGQYIAVCAAILNLMQLAYQLGVHAVAMFAPETIFGVPLWTGLGVLAHVLATLILRLCIATNISDDNTSNEASSRKGFNIFRCLGHFIKNEFTSSACHPPITPRKVSPKLNAGILPYILAWILSFGALVIMIFGTLVFSSLLFFNVLDSLKIVLRYIASVMVVRLVTSMERQGLDGSFERVDPPSKTRYMPVTQ